MRLLSLNIVGFRQHLSTGVWLANGLSGIIGANGSGKSSLVEAIAFALYGSKAIRGKIDDVKTRGHGKDLKPEVSLLFELGEKVFRVDRTFSDAALYFGGEPQPIAQGHRDVNSRIGHLLGMQYDEFVAAFYTEQKGLEFLSGKKGAAERERFIVRMMGYDKLEKVQELLRAERRDKKNELLGRSAALGNEQEFKDRIELERRKLAELDKSRSEAAAALERAERDYDRKIRDFKSLEKQAEIFDKH
ncbi:MAG: AAA family ATPase, partial [Bdellovibrionales bacterium]|nr:AAA family ATPase [Bdellovibrionales bacterium]